MLAMEVIIAGGGLIAAHIASQLLIENHSVRIIESVQEVGGKLMQKMDISVLLGECTSPAVLETAGIKSADLFIALTGNDDTNLAACYIARRYGVKKIVCRIRNGELTGGIVDHRDFGITSIIHTEGELKRMFLSSMQIPGLVDRADFAKGRVLVNGFRVKHDSPACSHMIVDLRKLSPDERFVICAVMHQGKVKLGKGDVVFAAGDIVYTISEEHSVPFLAGLFSKDTKTADQVVISGWNDLSALIAKAARKELGKKVFLIEPDSDKAQLAAETLFDCQVINGDSKEKTILDQAAVRGSFFLALSEDQEENLFAALVAREHGASRTGIITQNPEFVHIAESTGVDIVANGKTIAISQVLKLMRGENVVSGMRLHESEVEIQEILLSPKSQALDKPLKDLPLISHGIVVGAILRKSGQVVIPGGDTKFMPDDSAVLFLTREGTREIKEYFG